MSEYASTPVTIERPAAEIASKFNDFTAFQEQLDKLGDAERARIGDVHFTPDTIRLNTPQVGEIVLKAVERRPDLIRLAAEKSPVPLNLEVRIKEKTVDSCDVQGVIDVELPMMVRAFVGPTLQKAADQFGSLFGQLAR